MTSLQEHNVRITKEHITLESILGLPVEPRGVVIFAYGSGSGGSALAIVSSAAIYSKTDWPRCFWIS